MKKEVQLFVQRSLIVSFNTCPRCFLLQARDIFLKGKRAKNLK